MPGIGAKLPTPTIRAVCNISPNEGAIRAPGLKGHTVKLSLELNVDFATKNLIGELMEKREKQLYLTLSDYIPEVHDEKFYKMKHAKSSNN